MIYILILSLAYNVFNPSIEQSSLTLDEKAIIDLNVTNMREGVVLYEYSTPFFNTHFFDAKLSFYDIPMKTMGFKGDLEKTLMEEISLEEVRKLQKRSENLRIHHFGDEYSTTSYNCEKRLAEIVLVQQLSLPVFTSDMSYAFIYISDCTSKGSASAQINIYKKLNGQWTFIAYAFQAMS